MTTDEWMTFRDLATHPNLTSYLPFRTWLAQGTDPDGRLRPIGKCLKEESESVAFMASHHLYTVGKCWTVTKKAAKIVVQPGHIAELVERVQVSAAELVAAVESQPVEAQPGIIDSLCEPEFILRVMGAEEFLKAIERESRILRPIEEPTPTI